MTISIINSVQSTWIFTLILSIAILISAKFKKDKEVFGITTTQELKGFAILAIVFAHIGYFLVNDNRFLYPLSTISGVGVDLFLFLSGMGLVLSSIKKNLTPVQFYKHRLLKLFIPFWIVLIVFLLLDFFVLKIGYSWQFITKAFFGIFQTADLYHDIDSPLWYFTLILFYYLLFPLLFSKKKPWMSAIFVYLISYAILSLNLGILSGVQYFYQLHTMAFPLGMIFAWLLLNKDKIKNIVIPDRITSIGRYLLIAGLILGIGYLSVHSEVGKGFWIEQTISNIIALLIVFLFLLKKAEFKTLSLFGLYSYEIYLFHWPLLYRYDILYKSTPAWLATSLYLIIFLGLGWILQKTAKIINDKITLK